MKRKAKDLIVMKGFLDPDHEATGKKLRQMRLAAGIMAHQVAEGMKISPQYLSDLEVGRRNWTPKLAEAYAEELI